jgi:hypothetical protein
MNSWLKSTILLLCCFLALAGCYNFNNPVDPEADNYQGFKSEKPTTAPAGPLWLNVGVIGLTEPDREHEVRMTWTDAADNEEGFTVQRRSGADPWVAIADLPPDSGEYHDTTLSGDTTYTFRVLAYNILGSASSVEVSWTMAPAAPDGLVIVGAGASNIPIQWNDNSTTEDEYRIEHSTDGINWSEIATVTSLSTSYNYSGLPAGPHYLRIRAYSASSGFSTYSNVVDITL